MTRFDYFIVLAEMRTGSNFLEANLNALDGVTCFGEAFNPAFVGYPKVEPLFGITLEDREQDPQRLIEAIKTGDDLGGFRFFNDHDPRVLAICLADPRCAKVILTRNPLDSYVSWKIAQKTGQWKLTNATHSKSQQIEFVPEEFENHLQTIQSFQIEVLNILQKSGQTAFHIGYDDLRDIDVLNGLAMFLGTPSRLGNINKKLKKQNPEPIEDKVGNFADMKKALQSLDRFDLGRTPNFEPRRGPGIPLYFATQRTGLLYMPLRSGPDAAILDWMAGTEGGTVSDLLRDFSQKTLRQWQRDNPGHRKFTVLRHPLARAHAAFCDRILGDGAGSFPEIRAALRKVHKLPIPEAAPDLSAPSSYDSAAHRAGFLGFLKFLRNNLSGQTSIRVDASWAGQMGLLQGMAQFAVPDLVLREAQLNDDLALLAGQAGLAQSPALGPTEHPHHSWLAGIYDAEIESAARDAYARDYEVFGFSDWA
jgi:LPS sulfotransferase NodH